MKKRLPRWLKQYDTHIECIVTMDKLLNDLKLNTICKSAQCPNIARCYSTKTASFLILGDTCTRHCTFCAVKKGRPLPLDNKEPRKIQKAVEKLNLGYAVITSPTRDDLFDGGASQFAKTVRAIHNLKSTHVEILIPDFAGCIKAVEKVVSSKPEVINHNIETIPRLYKKVRPEANYQQSLHLLATIKAINADTVTKSGLILGLGEEMSEVIEVMRSIREAGCNLLTLGQYLQPSLEHFPVARYVPPEEFSTLGSIAKSMGFEGVVSSPLARSSFQAAELYYKAH